MSPPSFENFDLWMTKLSGLAGALVSTKFLQGTWPEKVFSVAAGALISLFVAPWLAAKVGLPPGMTGFLLGLFGMAVVSRMWEWVQTTPVAAIWQIVLGWFGKRAGVDPKNTGDTK